VRRLLVCHGAFNTVNDALCEGVPMVIVPLAWDHLEVAQRIVEAGAQSLTRTAINGIARLQDFADSTGFEFGSALKKLPYVFATITAALLRGAVIVMFIAGVKTAIWEYCRPEDRVLDFWDHLLSVAHSYTIEALLVFFGITALAKIVWRLRQADIEE
jgi:hypothetical protein